MSVFIAVLRSECNRFFTRRNLVIWIIVLTITLFSVNKGIDRYKESSEKIANFSKMQELRFNDARNFAEYVTIGIKIIMEQSPLNILFRNNTLPRDVTANMDQIVKLQIQNNLKGVSLNGNHGLGYFDFARIVLFLIGLAALWYGLETLGSKDFILSLQARRSRLGTIIALGVSRFIMLLATFLLYTGVVLVFVIIRGVVLTGLDFGLLAGYVIVTLGLLLFFFLLGMIAGTLSSPKIALAVVFIILFTAAYLIPVVLGSINESRFPDDGQDYRTETDKFSIVSKFEHWALEKYGKFDRTNIEVGRKVIEGFKANELLKIEEREEELLKHLEEAVRGSSGLGLVFPTTFYMVTCDELSGSGGESFLDFYRYAMKVRVAFVYFWIDRVFYHDPTQMVNFLDKEQHIYKSQSRLPRHFFLGMLALLGYILAAAGFFYYRFVRWLHPVTKDKEAFSGYKVEYGDGNVYSVELFDDEEKYMNRFLRAFYGMDSGTDSGDWVIYINGEAIAGREKQDFALVPNVYEIPGDLRVRDMILLYSVLNGAPQAASDELAAKLGKEKLNRRFGRLEESEKVALVLKLSLLAEAKTVIYKDFGDKVLKHQMEQLRNFFHNVSSEERVFIVMESRITNWLPFDEIVCDSVSLKNKKYDLKRRGGKNKVQ